jgi:4-diphosphocytidyl-2-C-methyl-D-erythritol kinase
METRLVAHACAKVNLSLEILRKRADGFHEIETIFQSVGLYDKLDLTIRPKGSINISSSDPELPRGEGNLCFKAVKEFRKFTDTEVGADIHITKNIPQNAGLGGGSSDAAAVLLALNRAGSPSLPLHHLDKIAAGIGSDVPFMLHGGTMLGKGRGEQLTPLVNLHSGWFLIIKPPVDISTDWVYKNYNFRLTRHRYRINLKSVNAILARFPNAKLSFRNALEDVVCPAFPVVAEALEELLEMKPFFASMSGSGSALYAIFKSEAVAARVAEEFSVKGYFTAVVQPTLRAVELSSIAA